jgi:hypothetical protein
MNLHSLVVVLLRLFSLDFLFQVFFRLLFQLPSLISGFQHLPGDEFRSAIALPFLVILGMFLGAVLLWVFAMPIARLVTRGLPVELSFGALYLSDCYSIVFVGLGLYYAVMYFPSVLNWSYYLLKMEASQTTNYWRKDTRWYEVSLAFLTFILGMVLFVNGRKWAVALANKQTKESTAGPAPTNPEQPTVI